MTGTIVEGTQPIGAPVGHSPKAKERRSPNEQSVVRRGSA